MAAVTWNPADKSTYITLSIGDLVCEANQTQFDCVRATLSKAAGKWYWEVRINNLIHEHRTGIGKSTAPLTSPVGADADSYGYCNTGTKNHNGSNTAYGNSYTTGDVIGIAVDFTAGKIWFAKNNVWQASGDPAAGTNEAFSGISGTFFPMHECGGVGAGSNDDIARCRFTVCDQGHSPPAGFSSLDPEYVLNLASALTAVSGLQSNFEIVLNLQSALTGVSGLGSILNVVLNLSSPFAAASSLSSILAIKFSTSPFVAVTGGSITRIWYPLLDESIFMWATPKAGWGKSIADSMAIVDVTEKILGIPVPEVLTLADSQETTWKGTENIADTFFLIDIPEVVEVFDDLIADGITAVDAVRIVLELMITDILTCTDSIVDVGKFQFSASDTMGLDDIAIKAWEKTAADAITIVDSNTPLYLALPIIADAFAAVDATTPGLTINQVIADALQALDTASLQQIVQELIADGLALDILVELNDELWECWVLNTAAFHPSVYSGYGYNSFAIDKINNTVYGWRSDGVYELTGNTDDGTPFHSGIVLPSTTFGLSNKKKFRKAMMGVSGDSLVMKVETDNGSKTFIMTNARIDITRDLRGRSWTFSLEGFDTLDMIELYPVILSKK